MTSKSVENRHDPQNIEIVILRALQGIRFGSVEITVHDSKIVQIERKEKLRPSDHQFPTAR